MSQVFLNEGSLLAEEAMADLASKGKRLRELCRSDESKADEIRELLAGLSRDEGSES